MYLGYQPKDDDPDPDPELICQLLDTHYHTDCFSLLYKEKQQEVDKRFDEETRPIELFGAVIQYELKMPGQMISANTTFRDREYLVWKVDAYRLLAGEYSFDGPITGTQCLGLYSYRCTDSFGNRLLDKKSDE